MTEEAWPGCHGTRLRPDRLAAGFGSARGVPLLEAEIVEAEVGPPGDREIWRMAEEVSLPAGRVRVDQRLTRRSDGSFVLHTPDAAMAVDPAASEIVLDASTDSLAKQLVTTYAIPLLLDGRTAVALHACAAMRADGDAMMICGPSGSGKSSLLSKLIGAGFRAVSEDVCVVDLREASPRVWPGPPWIRLRGPGPDGATVRFEAAVKTAWDIAPWQPEVAVGLTQLVFLEPAGGEVVRVTPLSRAEAIARLARHTIWLREPDERGRATFSSCVAIASAANAISVRLPVADDWAELAMEALEAT